MTAGGNWNFFYLYAHNLLYSLCQIDFFCSLITRQCRMSFTKTFSIHLTDVRIFLREPVRVFLYVSAHLFRLNSHFGMYNNRNKVNIIDTVTKTMREASAHIHFGSNFCHEKKETENFVCEKKNTNNKFLSIFICKHKYSGMWCVPACVCAFINPHDAQMP